MRLPLPPRRAIAPAVVLTLLLAACAAAFDEPLAHAATPPDADMWPPAWRDPQQPASVDFTPPAFEVPSASHCHRLPTTREVPGVWERPQETGSRSGGDDIDRWGDSSRGALSKRKDSVGTDVRKPSAVLELNTGSAAPAAKAAMPSSPSTADREAATDNRGRFVPPPWPRPPQPAPQRPAHETVTAGMVDDNADFGEYLAYRQRNAGLPVRQRDIDERYLLEVTNARGNPVHDAEVAVQRAGVAEPVMWARTDTAGRVWLHPRAFLPPSVANDGTLGIAVRKGSQQSRALLRRGQAAAVQVRLETSAQDPQAQRPRLDLVFLIDATGSMGDEIAKLKRSMQAIAQQIAQLPSQPDVCYGLVAYRDRGDAFLTRTHDFTDNLGAFQQMLARVHADGGGDTPEALNEALHEAVHGLSWRSDAARIVMLVADAPPHLDYVGCGLPLNGYHFPPQRVGKPQPGICPQYDRDMQAALAKGIKLFAVGASGLDPVGEYIFRQMAQYTAGRFVFLTYRDAADPGSGPGTQTVHDVKQYSVQTLDKLVVRLVSDELVRLKHS